MKNLYKIILVILVVLVLLAAAILAMKFKGGNAHSTAIGGGSFRLKVSDPEYTDLLSGKKTVEARLDRPPFSRLEAGDPVVIVRSRPKGDTSEYPGGKYKYDAEVVRVAKYKNIDALLKGEGVAKVYPGKTASEAVSRFSEYLPPDTSAASDPVIAIELRAASGAKAAKKVPKIAARLLNPNYDSFDPYDL